MNSNEGMQPSFSVDGEEPPLKEQEYLIRLCHVFGNWWKHHTLSQYNEEKSNEAYSIFS